MTSPHVSIIIAAYNEGKYISACLESLKKQDIPDVEIIVADDGSTDQTRQIATDAGSIVISSDHKGTAITRNAAAEKAHGEILIFLDADMTFAPDFVSKLVAPIQKGESKGTFSKLEYVKNWDKPFARCWNKLNPRLSDRLRIPQDTDVGDDFRAILTTEFRRVGGFDDVGYTDTWTLAKKLGYRPTVALDAIYYHANPETIEEVYDAASWIGKRSYRWGIVGKCIALIRANVLLAFIKGLVRVFTKQEPAFLLFQLFYDAGISAGIVRSILFHDVKK